MRREMFTDWERSIRLAVAKFRADSAAPLGDPSFEELIQSLRQSSPEFCKVWKRHEVARSGEGRKELQPPSGGTLVFEHAVFNPVEAPEQRLILYTPRARSRHSRRSSRGCSRTSRSLAAGARRLNPPSALFESSSPKFTVLSQSDGEVAP